MQNDNDLIKRLKECGNAWGNHGYYPDAALCYEVADEIQRLRDECDTKSDRIYELAGEKEWWKELALRYNRDLTPDSYINREGE